jgi:hypothetical protein
MAIDWIEAAFITTGYEWRWTQPIESDWIRIRSTLYEYPVIYKSIWGMICQGTNQPLQLFQKQRFYQSQKQSVIFYFPRPPLLLPSERRIGILGQRFLKFKNPNASWVVHIDTPRIPINATLPDYTNPANSVLNESQIQQLALAIVNQQQKINDTIDITPYPDELL